MTGNAIAENIGPRLSNNPSARELLATSNLPAAEARALLAHQLGVTRESLIARPEQRIARGDAQSFMQLVERRWLGEPLAYLLGEKEFFGRMFAVSPAVLIPRPETEMLVEVALRLVARPDAHVLDLGTGSGCIGITLALERAGWRVAATDLSAEALVVARRNASRWQAGNITFYQGSWFDAIGALRFDIVVANPPYVATGDPHLDALRFEPTAALVADGDGLGCLQAIISGAPAHLVAGGYLALEHGHNQGLTVRSVLSANGWRNIQTDADLAGLERVTYARAPAFDALSPLATLDEIQSG